MATILSNKELNETLQNNESTCNWDAVVSYSQREINQLLKEKWTGWKNRISLEFTLRFGSHIIDKYSISLGLQLLQFDLTRTRTCAEITLSLEGTRQLNIDGEDEKPEEIAPGRYRLKTMIPLASMHGEEVSERIKNNLVFDDESTADSYSAIHFDTQFSHWTVIRSNQDDSDEQVNEICENIRRWCGSPQHIAKIIVSLGRVPRPNGYDSASFSLSPKTFRFAGQPGVLNIFIDTGASQREYGDCDPRFSTNSVSPVSKHSSASIIISRNVFQNAYLVEQIKSRCPELSTHKGVVPKSVESGISLELRYSHKTIIRGDEKEVAHWKYIADGVVVDFAKHPLTLEVYDEAPYQELKYRWRWSYTGQLPYIVVEPSGYRNISSADESKTLATIKDNEIELSLRMEDSDQPKCHLIGADRHITPHAALEKLNISLPRIDYFELQNILVPGSRCIEMKTVMIPYDCVLSGDVLF
ncbi:hypothetical protein MGYG_04061 [Nannizzia gypsea CBS 118893]|uniref:Uncharacterized protein n=1 Tax=Arthroderma gypseum (strain ATCC MYA-4604 / CBS 118893) TaxID=535722 RepID=E4UUU1_ARTGP|nr:hypothetical protein MGYG_04061 [Nannizzia gypsea CBS 118893]EFR01058.1 hypothetical protein MGYG_04061 [Nannizzia gypsea CBS 118893]